MPFIERDKYSNSWSGPLSMIATRAIDPFLRYYLLYSGALARALTGLGLKNINPGAALQFSRGSGVPRPSVTSGSTSFLTLGKLNGTASLLVLMTAAATLKHAYWAAFTRPYHLPVSTGTTIGIFNTLLNTINSGLLIYNLSRHPLTLHTPGRNQWVGLGLFIFGLLAELIPEETRRRFKKNPAHKGKVDATGAFAIVRHPNFAGYTLWRTGLTLATGSITGAALTFVAQFWAFRGSAEELSEQMHKKYGDEWVAYTKRVPYKLFPGIY